MGPQSWKSARQRGRTFSETSEKRTQTTSPTLKKVSTTTGSPVVGFGVHCHVWNFGRVVSFQSCGDGGGVIPTEQDRLNELFQIDDTQNGKTKAVLRNLYVDPRVDDVYKPVCPPKRTQVGFCWQVLLAFSLYRLYLSHIDFCHIQPGVPKKHEKSAYLLPRARRIQQDPFGRDHSSDGMPRRV